MQDLRIWINGLNGRFSADGKKSSTPEIAANAALTLIGVSCFLLDRQIKRLADDFKKEGGFTERLYRVRSQERAEKAALSEKAFSRGDFKK